jgi:hypothetical protein
MLAKQTAGDKVSAAFSAWPAKEPIRRQRHISCEGRVVAFVFGGGLFGFHVCFPKLTQSHDSCPPNRGKADFPFGFLPK